MEFVKKHWLKIVIVLIVLYALWYFFMKKKGTESSFDSNLMIPGDQSNFNFNRAAPTLTSLDKRVNKLENVLAEVLNTVRAPNISTSQTGGYNAQGVHDELRISNDMLNKSIYDIGNKYLVNHKF